MEFLVYIGMAAIVFSILGNFSFETIWNKARVATKDEVSQNARFVLARMSFAIRNAQAINSPLAGSSSPALSLAMLAAAANPTVFDLFNGAVRISEGGSPPESLTSNEVTVTSLQFLNVSYIGTPGTIRIEMTIEFNNASGRHEFDFTERYYTTINLRKR